MRLVNISSDSDSRYKRTFESMGSGLLLIRVENEIKSQTPYHYLFESGWKPPFDVAINPSSRKISYFKFFLQDEKVGNGRIFYEFDQFQGDAEFSIEPFNEKKYEVFIKSDFDVTFKDSCLILVRKDQRPIKELKISEGVRILFNKDNDFTGVILESILEHEFLELEKSDVLN